MKELTIQDKCYMGKFRAYGDHSNWDYWTSSTTFGDNIKVNYMIK
jgi:hypothetical protein